MRKWIASHRIRFGHLERVGLLEPSRGVWFSRAAVQVTGFFFTEFCIQIERRVGELWYRVWSAPKKVRRPRKKVGIGFALKTGFKLGIIYKCMSKHQGYIGFLNDFLGFTRLYLVLLGLTGFYRVLPVFTGLGFTGFYQILQGLTGFSWVLLSSTCVFQGFTGFYWVLLSFMEFYWVLLGFTGFFLCFSGFFLILLGFTGFNWV